jgi:hypothetical protein
VAIAVMAYVTASGPVAMLVTAAMGSVFGLAFVYETLRARRQPDPLQTTPTVVAIWSLIGFGYLIRVAVGLALGGVALTSAVGALWLSYFFLLGSTYVLLSWVLEAASFCHLAPGAHWRVRVDIAAKPHLGALLPYAGIHPALNAPPRAVGAAPRLRPDPRAAWPPPRPPGTSR